MKQGKGLLLFIYLFFCQENALIIANTLFQQHKRRLYIHMDLTRWSILKSDYIFAAKDGEALYSQQKQD